MRLRINRFTPSRRDLIYSRDIEASLVQPHYVVSGESRNEEIKDMPGIYRQSVDILVDTIGRDMDMGLKSHMLFYVMDEELKDPTATMASKSDSPLNVAIRELRMRHGNEIVIFSDVCLCTGTDHGHCGVLEGEKIANDKSVRELVRIALSNAEAGVDYISLSDMMDNRVGEVRGALEEMGHHETGILSYSVKYASSFYGPFRDAASSSPKFGDRKSHQMDVRSGYDEALLEALQDEREGADIIMIKPGLPYLDVLKVVSDEVLRPVAVYNVSGEYSMVHKSCPDSKSRGLMIAEVLSSFARSGASIIVTYHAREAFSEKLLR